MRPLGIPGALLGACLLASAACSTTAPPASTPLTDGSAELLHEAIDVVTWAMIESITSPPVSSRTYSYASIAAYEVLRSGEPGYRSLAGQVNELTPLPEPEGKEHLPLAGLHAFLTVAEALVFKPEPVAAEREELVAQARAERIDEEVIEASLHYGEAVAAHVLAWAAEDGIKAARAAPRLEIQREPGLWIPTPPAYMDPVEPNWGTIRPFALDSPDQFRPIPPVPYDMTEGSEFYDLMMEVYDAGEQLTPEQREIAAFWDCNPFALESIGHMMVAAKKMSPGGHWIGIARIVLRDLDASLLRSAEAYARVGMATSDGFISSWDEKYHSVRVRPVTVIQELIDPEWMPVLQTPPFPEYTSGHSVISMAAAEVLTAMFGDQVNYVDDTEVPFGLPTRSFKSFYQAAQEAAISRLYGGIHYRDAIDVGMLQGSQVGKMVAMLETDQPMRTERSEISPTLASSSSRPARSH